MAAAPVSTLFVAGAWRAVELYARDERELQRFYDSNPEYGIAVSGEPPAPHEARETFAGLPPAEWRFGRKWVLGFRNEHGALDGMADLLSGLFVDDVWHIGLFIVATALHGRGAAGTLYAGLEAWMIAQGAAWSRLGVVQGNVRAERFWERLGYREVRQRGDVRIGPRVNTVRVMVKGLTGGDLANDYLARVARDRPG